MIEQLVRPSPAAAAAIRPVRRSLRILVVASEAPPTRSGIARTIESLGAGLTERGHQVDVLAHPAVSRFVLREVRLYNLLSHLPGLRRSLNDYDVVHLHGAVPTLSDAFLLSVRAGGKRPPLVYTHHCDIGIGSARVLTGIYNRLHRRLSSVADQQVCTTPGYAAHLGVSDDTAIIPLGIDVARFATARGKDQRFTVLFVGQFRPYKGVPLLLRAMAKVRGSRLIVAGRGAGEQAYRALGAALGVDVEFHVSATDADLRRLYQRAHVIVLPSVTNAEAFGLVLLEGMAAGCVPVASDLPGVRDVLGRIGFTFPVRSERALASTLRFLRDNPALVSDVGQRARGRASLFTWERTISDYERLFQDLVMARRVNAHVAGTEVLDAPLPEALAAHILANLAAERVDVVFRTADDDAPVVGSAAPLGFRAAPPAARGAAMVAAYACQTGESVLVARDSGPLPLMPHLEAGRLPMLGVPLEVGGRRFGSFVAERQDPFDQRDLDGLQRLARHVSPGLLAWQGQQRRQC